MKYSVDTSALIHAWRRAYPMDIFSPVWRWLETLIQSGDLRATAAVIEELQEKDDDLLRWVKSEPAVVVALDDDVQRAARDILTRFPDFVDANATKPQADPFVVALAVVHGLVVVTQERVNAGRPRIPNVCQAYGIECRDLLGLMRGEGFSLR